MRLSVNCQTIEIATAPGDSAAIFRYRRSPKSQTGSHMRGKLHNRAFLLNSRLNVSCRAGAALLDGSVSWKNLLLSSRYHCRCTLPSPSHSLAGEKRSTIVVATWGPRSAISISAFSAETARSTSEKHLRQAFWIDEHHIGRPATCRARAPGWLARSASLTVRHMVSARARLCWLISAGESLEAAVARKGEELPTLERQQRGLGCSGLLLPSHFPSFPTV